MERSPSFFSKLGAYLVYPEIASILITLIGIGLNQNDPSSGFGVIMVGMTALACIHFLYAYTMVPEAVTDPDAPPKTFVNRLPLIVRRILFIGSSISIVGLLYAVLLLPGSIELVTIGGVALFTGTLLSVFLILKDNEVLALLRPALVRAIPILLLIAYWKFGR